MAKVPNAVEILPKIWTAWVGRKTRKHENESLRKHAEFIHVYDVNNACPLNRDQVRSLEFAANSWFRKIFCVGSQTVIEECKTLTIYIFLVVMVSDVGEQLNNSLYTIQPRLMT